MTDYSELVKALRCKRDDCEGCDLAFFDKDEGWMCQYAAKDDDAADAIEELQSILTEADKKQAYQHDYICELVAEKEELQAETERLQAQLPKRGEWEPFDKTKVRCTSCGAIFGNAVVDLYQYCPMCGSNNGAKMEVQDGK